MKDKILYIILITIGLVNIIDVFAMSMDGDEDGDGVPNGADDCPNYAADYNTHQGSYFSDKYGSGCPSYCPHRNCTIEPPKPVYLGPEWILKIINWHNQSRIDDTTYNNAINYLLQKHIITIK